MADNIFSNKDRNDLQEIRSDNMLMNFLEIGRLYEFSQVLTNSAIIIFFTA